MRRFGALVAAAVLVAGCGGAGAELPDGAGEDYQRWRTEVEEVCESFRSRVEKLPNPSSKIREGSDAERLRKLADAAQPIADQYLDAARRTRAVKLPRERADVARDYVERFERRARAYATIPRVARTGDRDETTELTNRDEQLARQLAFATEQAGIRC